MAYGFVFPKVAARDVAPVKTQRKLTVTGKKARGAAHKFDHLQMLLDKLNGMSWKEIAVKHNVTTPNREKMGDYARRLALNSKAIVSLTPAQVEN